MLSKWYQLIHNIHNKHLKIKFKNLLIYRHLHTLYQYCLIVCIPKDFTI